MRRLHRYAILGLVLIAANLFVPVVYAHPLGNFTINHYAGLHISQNAFSIDYVLDMAEIPTYQEISDLDTNHNGQPDPEEVRSYPNAKCESIRTSLDLQANGRSLDLDLVSSSVDFPPGQGGLLTLRLTCAFHAPTPSLKTDVQVAFRDNFFADRLGWREIVVIANGVSIQGDVTSSSVSNRLTSYPKDLLTSPLNQRQVSFTVKPGAITGQQPITQASQALNSLPGNPNDAFTRLILLEDLNLPALLFALVISFVWGALHALTPGHGKTIVGAYLVGSRGTARHAIWLGLATTITHTAGVFALGLVTLFAAHFIMPEKLFPWLSFLSGILVVAIGMNLFLTRLRSTRRPALPAFQIAWAAGPDQGNLHRSIRSNANLQVAGHEHPHQHRPEQVHNHNKDLDHPHSHVGAGGMYNHTHLPPGSDGTPVTWRSLLALGISGGILPCPSALVVLLSAIALNRIAFGIILVLAFSLGLAGVLTGIGLLFVYSKRFFDRVPLQGRLVRLLPAFSALFIAVVGLAIAVRALVDMGIIHV